MDIVLIGLGPMGYNLAQNLISNGYRLSAFETNPDVVASAEEEPLEGLLVCSSAAEACKTTAHNKIILLTLPANRVDRCIDELIEFVNPNDIIADLGNSLHSDSAERSQRLSANGIQFLGVGVSGGPHGARAGPAIMAGGSETAWLRSKSIFENVAAKQNGVTSCEYFGKAGSGHFVKTVHNGIEYALMQSLAEVCNILGKGYNSSPSEQAAELMKLNNGNSSSFLSEVSIKALREKNNDGEYLLNLVDSKIGQNGTGIWALKAALDLGVSVPSIYAAVSTRALSQTFNNKVSQSGTTNLPTKNQIQKFREICIEEVVFFSFICALFQGLTIIREANRQRKFSIEIKRVLDVWGSGSILRGNYLEHFQRKVGEARDIEVELLYDVINENMPNGLANVRSYLAFANDCQIPTPVLSACLSYYDTLFSSHKIGEILQLQRSIFGQHPLKHKTDNKEIEHCWTNQ